MPEDLGERNEVVRVVLKEPLRHRVTKKVRVDLHADQCGILVAEFPHACLGQCSTASKEDPVGG